MSKFIDISDVRSFVKDWNLKYPIDRWWRDKYNIPFGSPQHLDQSFLDMRIAFEDEFLHVKSKREYIEDQKKKDGTAKYQPGRGCWLKVQPKFKKMTSGDVDDVFDRLSSDLSRLKDISTLKGENGKQKIRV